MAYGSKVVPVEDAVAVIRPGDTVATSGFVGVGTPDAVIAALEARFVESETPRDLTLVFAAAPGDGRRQRLEPARHEGLVRRVIGGHFGLVPKISQMVTDGVIEGYNLPLGCISQLFREIAGRKAGLISKVGLQTFVDPREGGGKLNDRDDGGPRRAAVDRRANSGCSTRRSRSRLRSCAARPPTPRATSPWSARR